jgi:hypothetical protein
MRAQRLDAAPGLIEDEELTVNPVAVDVVGERA